ncbi:MAG: 2-phospho-L-lactate transferase [Candidatus Dormibacteria bacterium]|jgi:LPPG:FO 2-phospho-L-lactate transferase
MRVTVLAGGTGAARLACGLARVLAPGELSVITNTADDLEMWGLLICPDTDAVLYRLAGLFNADAGFGVRDETYQALEMLGLLGEPVWFGLGDRDLGLHLLRATLRRRGATLGEAVAEIGRRLGLATAVIPMSDDPVRTRVATDSGEMGFQEWFVGARCEPRVRGLRFQGLEAAVPAPAAVRAVADADLVVIGPSNPLLSVDPITALIAPHLERERVIAVSPIVGGRALKGPTVALMEQLGEEPSALGVARHYAGLAAGFVLDAVDRELSDGVARLGVRPHLLDTVMAGAEGEERLAREVLGLEGPAAH